MENENLNPIVDTVVDDESELDALINNTINEQKAENSGVVVPPETTKESVVTPVPATEVPQEVEAQKEEPISDLRAPIQGKFESDESYQVRLHIAEMIKQRESASTEDEKDSIQNELKNFRKEFGHLITNNRSQPLISNDTPSNEQEPQNALDIDSIVERKLVERQASLENKFTIDNFFKNTPELKDENVRQVFIDFFDANYKIDGKTGDQIVQVLNLAKQAMFRKSDSIQERVLAGSNLQEKINAMQFPGGTIVKPGLTADQQQSVNELVASGMSESKARELILD